MGTDIWQCKSPHFSPDREIVAVHGIHGPRSVLGVMNVSGRPGGTHGWLAWHTVFVTIPSDVLVYSLGRNESAGLCFRWKILIGGEGERALSWRLGASRNSRFMSWVVAMGLHFTRVCRHVTKRAGCLSHCVSAWRCFFSWLNLFNAELRPKKYWRGLRSNELGEERDCT